MAIILAVFCMEEVPAQKIAKTKENPAVKAYSDSLSALSASYFAYFRLWDDLNIPAPRWVRPNPAFYKLFVPPTYYEAPIKEIFEIKWSPDTKIMTAVDSLYMGKRDSASAAIYQLPDLETLAAADRWSNNILRNYYLQYPGRLVNNELYLADLKPLENNQIVKRPRKERIKSFLQPETPVESLTTDNELLVVRPNFWTHKGNGYVQFTQHYISDNWYKGGESTNALLSGLVLEANFDDRQRIEFENKLEIKLGFVTAPSDTVHKYKTNTNDMISNFLSPAQLDITLGMDFKQNKKNYSLSLLGSPLAYTFMYISNDKITDPGAFNVDPGHKTANLFGSKFTGNLTWTIIPSIVWESKLEYFTTYDTVIASWENTFNFVLNRYLSTKLFVHARYDDGVTLTEDNKSYFQLQELLSFGLNYTW